jgi:sialic acid synthase SpsE
MGGCWVSRVNFGRLIAEIGLNHLGSLEELNSLANILIMNKLSTTVQIREAGFYQKHPNLWIHLNELQKVRQLYKNNKVKFGIAIGPIDQELLDEVLDIKPDFIKLLGICSADSNFLKIFFSSKRPTTFISNGSWDLLCDPIRYAEKACDRIVHTVLSHELASQKISAISLLCRAGWSVSYGQHSSDISAIPLAIGAGAESIFMYVGDKTKSIPDYEHAIDITESDKYSKIIDNFYMALNLDSKALKIKFIG